MSLRPLNKEWIVKCGQTKEMPSLDEPERLHITCEKGMTKLTDQRLQDYKVELRDAGWVFHRSRLSENHGLYLEFAPTEYYDRPSQH